MTISNARKQSPTGPFAIRALGLAVLATALMLMVAPSPAQAKFSTFALGSPSNNKTVKSKIKFTALVERKLQARASGVEFWVDGDKVLVDRKAPYGLNVDTRKLTNGQHTFRINLITKTKSGKADPQVCQYLRAVYVNVKNKGAKAAKIKASAGRKPVIPGPISDAANKKKRWALKFQDEFAGTALDPAKWQGTRDDWIKGGNPYNDREGAWYKPENNTVAGGSLVQTIKAETAGDLIYTPHLFNYTTGMVNSDHRFSFQYGYVEARVRVPSCRGCWPVFWTLPDINTWPPEIDIFEFIDTAAAERRPFIASHWKDANGPQSELHYYTSPCGTATDYTNSWHTYGFLWNAGSVQPFLDGVPGPILTGAAVPQVPMYLIMALSTIDSLAPAPGSQMLTDYVRVWQPTKA